jgi:hypothetical protein
MRWWKGVNGDKSEGDWTVGDATMRIAHNPVAIMHCAVYRIVSYLQAASPPVTHLVEGPVPQVHEGGGVYLQALSSEFLDSILWEQSARERR